MPVSLILTDPPPGLALRPESDQDRPFVRDLYASTRAGEMAQVDWTQAQIDEFLTAQFQAQRQHYRQHYPGAEFLLVEQAGEPIGRVYVDLQADDLRLMDIALVPQWQQRGIGKRLMTALLKRAQQVGVPVSLHVEPFIPAYDWYCRLGFEQVEERGVYRFMRLAREQLAAAQEKLIS